MFLPSSSIRPITTVDLYLLRPHPGCLSVAWVNDSAWRLLAKERHMYIFSIFPLSFQFFLFFFSALFAFWLRSSVVSVLFSLISETVLRDFSLIIPIFDLRRLCSGLAYHCWHSVAGIALPPADANSFSHLFHHCIGSRTGLLTKKL